MEALVLVTGAPGTGKTSIAREIAKRLDLPLIENDVIKEALGSVFGAENVVASQTLGAATYRVMFAVASSLRIAILESNFGAALSREAIIDLHACPIEVFVRCDPALALQRYASRDRHPVHFDDEMLPVLGERLARGQSALALGGPVLEVDTTTGVATEPIADWVRARLRSGVRGAPDSRYAYRVT